MRILIGSGNAKKKDEMERLLTPLGVTLVSPADLVAPPESPEETGATFEANAEEKALQYAEVTGLITIADDSGLCVDALEGRPGVYSARYAGENATDEANNLLLLEELRDVPEERRGAAYVSVVVVAAPGRVLLRARGSCRGHLLREGRGTGGFGYDPLFFIPGLGKTFAELTYEEKATISHRGEALSELMREFPEMLAQVDAAP